MSTSEQLHSRHLITMVWLHLVLLYAVQQPFLVHNHNVVVVVVSTTSFSCTATSFFPTTISTRATTISTRATTISTRATTISTTATTISTTATTTTTTTSTTATTTTTTTTRLGPHLVVVFYNIQMKLFWTTTSSRKFPCCSTPVQRCQQPPSRHCNASS
ncbi:hypothetical protein FHG87_020676 [Trinorchestia longiramus]|nr:hypothetical protein FHG87_020676 [Trinorchestia longiramus]